MGAKPRRMDGYIRVSRRLGREGPAYISPDVQRRAIERWADFRSVEIVHWEVDEDESGGTQERPGLRRIMARIETGETDGIACWRLNRFARNVAAAIEDVQRVQAAGGSLAFVEEDIDPTGPFGSFVLTVLLAVATLERDNLVAGWKTAKLRAVTRGAPIGPTPFGYERSDEGTLRPHQRWAPVVAEAFHRAAQSGHAAAIDYLAAEAPDKRWTTTTLRRMVANRVYLGEVRWVDVVTRDAHEPLVDRATWERAQLPATVRRRRAGQFPLSGIARCASCGEPLVGARGGPDARRMYRCRAGLKTWRGERCAAPAVITAQYLEEHVLDEIETAYAAADRSTMLKIRSGEADDERLAATGAELVAAEHELARFSADPMASELLGENAWREALQARADRVEKALTAYLAAGEQTRSARAELPLDVLRSLQPEELSDVLRSAIRELRVAKGRAAVAERVELRFNDPDDHAGLASA